MNKDQIKGAAKELGGKIQKNVGKIVGSDEQEAKGRINEAEGKLQKSVGDVKEIVEDVKKAAKHNCKSCK